MWLDSHLNLKRKTRVVSLLLCSLIGSFAVVELIILTIVNHYCSSQYFAFVRRTRIGKSETRTASTSENRKAALRDLGHQTRLLKMKIGTDSRSRESTKGKTRNEREARGYRKAGSQ